MFEVNERFLEILQLLARGDPPPALPWVGDLREALFAMTPERRTLAARRSFLLLDLEFGDAAFWRRITNHRSRSEPSPQRPEIFPRAVAVELARAAVTLAWHAVRMDSVAATACLGMPPAVRDIIRRLSLTDIDRIASQRFHDVRPRWEERPEEWRRLLIDGQLRDLRSTRELNVRGLRLIAGAVLTSMIPMMLQPNSAQGPSVKDRRYIVRAEENIEAWVQRDTETQEGTEAKSIRNSR
jgi:hypothetical protein